MIWIFIELLWYSLYRYFDWKYMIWIYIGLLWYSLCSCCLSWLSGRDGLWRQYLPIGQHSQIYFPLTYFCSLYLHYFFLNPTKVMLLRTWMMWILLMTNSIIGENAHLKRWFGFTPPTKPLLTTSFCTSWFWPRNHIKEFLAISRTFLNHRKN